MLGVITDPLQSPHDNIKYENRLINNLNIARRIVRERLAIIQERQKKYYDKGRTEVKFEAGELVLVYKPFRLVAKAEKLLSRWLGPFRVIRQTSPVDYEVETKTGKSDIVHVSTMKRFNEREEVKEKDTRPNNRHPGKETRARGRPRKQLTDHKDEYVPLVTRRHFDNLEKTVQKENFDPPIIQEVRRRSRPRKQWNDPNAKHLNSILILYLSSFPLGMFQVMVLVEGDFPKASGSFL